MPTGLHRLAAALDAQLADTDAAYAATYPGTDGARQPVHTVYVPADRYDAGIAARWGADALDVLDTHIDGPADLAAVTGIEPELADAVLPLVEVKLRTEPIEDLRIDFEDGFTRPGIPEHERDADEDAHVARAAVALATDPTATPFVASGSSPSRPPLGAADSARSTPSSENSPEGALSRTDSSSHCPRSPHPNRSPPW